MYASIHVQLFVIILLSKLVYVLVSLSMYMYVHAKATCAVFHTESLLLRLADGGPDPIWAGKVIQIIL